MKIRQVAIAGAGVVVSWLVACSEEVSIVAEQSAASTGSTTSGTSAQGGTSSGTGGAGGGSAVHGQVAAEVGHASRRAPAGPRPPGRWRPPPPSRPERRRNAVRWWARSSLRGAASAKAPHARPARPRTSIEPRTRSALTASALPGSSRSGRVELALRRPGARSAEATTRRTPCSMWTAKDGHASSGSGAGAETGFVAAAVTAERECDARAGAANRRPSRDREEFQRDLFSAPTARQ